MYISPWEAKTYTLFDALKDESITPYCKDILLLFKIMKII